jgi:hypothetical protein
LTTASKDGILEDGYLEDLQRIARYLTTLRRPNSIGRGEFRAFKKCALWYAVIDKQLYLVGNKNILSCIVIDLAKRQAEILKELHNECRHKGRESTYHKVTDRYY